MLRVLIVAYGNPLRCDDGVAWRAADALEQKLPAGVEIVRLHQLAPELAETASHFQLVIFLDASAPSPGQGEPGEIRFEEIPPNGCTDATHLSHVISPQTVVSLAATLYDANPKAFLATVIGANFDHGDSFSPAVSAALPILISKIELFVQSTVGPDSLPRL